MSNYYCLRKKKDNSMVTIAVYVTAFAVLILSAFTTYYFTNDYLMDYYADLGYNEVQARMLLRLGDTPGLIREMAFLGSLFAYSSIAFGGWYLYLKFFSK